MAQAVKEPEVWKKLGGYLHQDYMLMYPDFWSGISEFSASLNCNERDELITYLTLLTTVELPGGELKKRWRNSGAQIVLRRGKPKEFFLQLLEKVISSKESQ